MKGRHKVIEEIKLLSYWYNQGVRAKQGLSHDEPAINTKYYDEFLRGMG